VEGLLRKLNFLQATAYRLAGQNIKDVFLDVGRENKRTVAMTWANIYLCAMCFRENVALG